MKLASILASKSQPVIAVDFDGVLHEYDGDHKKVSEPVKGAREGIQQLLDAGMKVVVFSCKSSSLIKSWLKTNGFPALEVTDKKPIAVAYLDDRGVQFQGTWSRDLIQQLLHFSPYWKKSVKATESMGTGTLTMPRKEFIKEHKNLVKVLRKGSQLEQEEEAKEQWKELNDLKAEDWFETVVGLSPVPTFHPPSLKNPKSVPQDFPQDGWHKNDSKYKKKRAKQDLAEIVKRLRRQIGKPEISHTAINPIYPTGPNF